MRCMQWQYKYKMRWCAVWCSVMWYCAVRCGTIQINAVQCHAIRRNVVRCSAILCMGYDATYGI